MKYTLNIVRAARSSALVVGCYSILSLLLLVAAGTAHAATAPMAQLPPRLAGLAAEAPIEVLSSPDQRPLGFRSDERQALHAAKLFAPLAALHRRERPLKLLTAALARTGWEVQAEYHGKVVALVEENIGARVTHFYTGPQALNPPNLRFFPAFGKWFVLLPASVLFLLVFFDPARPFRLLFLDGLWIIAWLVSYLLFDHGHLVASVWLFYPPLLYLFVRLGVVGGVFGRRRVSILPRSKAPLAGFLSTRTLCCGLLLMVVARETFAFVQTASFDVAYASLTGAYRLVHGLPIYYASTSHFDTYGPLTYLAYVPFLKVFGFSGFWDQLPAARAAAIGFDLLTYPVLFALGRRLLPGREGTRLGLVLCWAFAACPFTLFALQSHTNDGLAALIGALALLAYASPVGSGALLACATAAKIFPAALGPLFAAPRQRGWKGAATFCSTFVLVVAAFFMSFTPPGGLGITLRHILGFQAARTDVYSPWALYPSLKPLQDVVLVLTAAFCFYTAFVPRVRTLSQSAALAAACTIAVEICLRHWFFLYADWFMPFLLVGLLGRETAGSGNTAGGDGAREQNQQARSRGERVAVT